MKLTCQQYNLEPEKFYLFIHCREPKEIQRIVNTYNAKTLLIKRGELVVTSNHADANVNDYNYDFVINNNGSLEELRDKAKLFMGALRTKTNCPYCGHHINSKEEYGGYCPICDISIPDLTF